MSDILSVYPTSESSASSASDPTGLVVITGPSGVGKGTILKALLQEHPELCLSVSATTRSPRPGEVEGEHYYFLDRPKFETLVQEKQLLEWAEFAGNYYGTPRQPIVDRLAQGQRTILEIELNGARQVRQTFPAGLQIFLLPPSIAELEARIRKRGQDAEEAIQRRLHQAELEIAAASEFDVQIVNETLEKTLVALRSALSLV
jgi:guanylate kinase